MMHTHGTIRRHLLTMLVATASVCGIVSCGDDFTYSSYPCYLTIDNSIHQDQTLAAAMNAMSPGVFCIIKIDGTGKAFMFENNFGQRSSCRFTAVDERLSHHLGMNNGVIVGYGTLSNGTFMAYDLQCPECFDPHSDRVVSRNLTLESTGTAYCRTCENRYDLNNFGICLTASHANPKPLTQYRCSTTGPLGTLHVGN